MAEPAKKLSESVATARRVVMSDVIKRADWLVERVTRRYPTIPKQAALGWLRNVSEDSRNFMFITNEGGMALFERLGGWLGDPAVVVERFVFAWDQASIPQAAMLYRDVRQWAELTDAKEVHIERFTDVPRGMIKMYLGRQLFERVTLYALTEK